MKISQKTKPWQKYSKYLLKGDWQIHTNYTDGRNTVFEYCERAVQNKLELIAFTEHVRFELDYIFDNLVEDVKNAREIFNIEILIGCEAKVLDINGNLDASKNIIEKCDIVLAAFHSFQKDEDTYFQAIRNMLMNPIVDIWSHPTLFARNNGIKLPESEIDQILKLCKENSVLLDFNSKYKLPSKDFREKVLTNNLYYVFSSDAHGVEEMLSLA